MNKKELEINGVARNLKRAGDFDGLRNYAKEKGICDKQIDEFILGERLVLEESVNTEDDVQVDVIVPFYKSIEEKLEQEQEDLLKEVKDNIQKQYIKGQLKNIVDYILADDDLKAKAFLNWKELSRCYKSITKNAEHFAINGVACISGDVVFDWIKAYYELDDQKEVEEDRKNKAIQAKKAEERKKEAENKKKAAKKPRKTKTKEEKEDPTSKSSNEQVESEAKVDDELVVSEETVNTSL